MVRAYAGGLPAKEGGRIDWITLAQVLTGVSTTAMLAVWAFYAKLFFEEYRSSRRPWLVIHQSGTTTPSSQCLLINMNRHPALVSAVLVVVRSEDRGVSCRYPGARWVPTDGEPGPSEHEYREGPLPSGGVVSLGSFHTVVHTTLSTASHDLQERDNVMQQVRSVEVRVIAATPPDSDDLIGAYRRFTVEECDDERVVIMPTEMHTPHVRAKRGSGEPRRWLEEVTSDGAWEFEVNQAEQ